MPERTRNNSVRLGNWRSDATGLVARAMPQVNTRTTVVRTAVARLESTPATPTLAKTAVIPAKKADSKAQVIQFMGESLLDEEGVVNPTRQRGGGPAPGGLHGYGLALSHMGVPRRPLDIIGTGCLPSTENEYQLAHLRPFWTPPDIALVRHSAPSDFLNSQLDYQPNLPEQIVPSGVTAIAAKGYHSLFLKSDGSLW